jgi:hypothetical protein
VLRSWGFFVKVDEDTSLVSQGIDVTPEPNLIKLFLGGFWVLFLQVTPEPNLLKLFLSTRFWVQYMLALLLNENIANLKRPNFMAAICVWGVYASLGACASKFRLKVTQIRTPCAMASVRLHEDLQIPQGFSPDPPAILAALVTWYPSL